MRQEWPTLIDRLYAQTHIPVADSHLCNAMELRQRIYSGRRFMLDANMSIFLGELSIQVFKVKTPKLQHRLLDSIRTSARLPHRVTWLEIDAIALSREMKARYPEHVYLGEQIPERILWLLEQAPNNDNMFRGSLFSGTLTGPIEQRLPFSWDYWWRTDNGELPKNLNDIAPPRVAGTTMGGFLTGVPEYRSPQLGALISSWLAYSSADLENFVHELDDWRGCIRQVWALLTTLNDLPTVLKTYQPSKGFHARGNYKKFLSHSLVTINVPAVEHRKFARHIVALARRRAHQVRGHWRKDWKHPGVLHQHLWREDQTCLCGAHRLWITEHQRGDASLGFVTHDYKVTHEVH